ncbi:unnamed protein product, partial [Thelazia callipaeda]|uniref:Keratinocyte proline-rich protein n=1 Tax=Thelazia callipaeda TaxID=103827 RepID=A0A0N5CYY9_THECL
IKPRTRAKRCVCITIGCGCYQSSAQQLSVPYRQPIYQQSETSLSLSSCVNNCMQSCIRNHYSFCQQSCQQSCRVGTTYHSDRYSPAPNRLESSIQELSNGQQSTGGTCVHVCMPTCDVQCVQQTTAIPVVSHKQPQRNPPIPVVQSQTPSYQPSEQYEPIYSVQPLSTNNHEICIYLCMPSCENRCIERTTAVPSLSEQTDQPDIYTTANPHQNINNTPDIPPSYPISDKSTHQSSIIIRPQHGATICVPICMPSCHAQCTETFEQGEKATEIISSTEEVLTTTTAEPELPPYEISITLPQSIQQSPECFNLCQETCMQQCIGQNQPAEQCRPSCSYTCQESCAQVPVSSTASSSNKQQQESNLEPYETISIAPSTDPSPVQIPAENVYETPLRSPPYYQQYTFPEPLVTGCLSTSMKTNRCVCSPGYALCFSISGHTSLQHQQHKQCCRRRR